MSLCTKKTTDIKLEAVRVLWGIEQCRTYDVNGAAADYDALYFGLNLIDENFEEIKGYVYLDTGVSVDPAPVGLTLIATASVNNADSDELNAAAIITALDASAQKELMSYEINPDDLSMVTIKNNIIGLVSAEDAGDSLFDYVAVSLGLGGNLGKTAQGGVTLNLETSTVELKSDQTAELLLGEINQGNLTTIETELIEVTKERINTLIGSVVGDIVDLGLGETYMGLGTSKLFQELSALGGRMVLHPLRIESLADRSNDWSFHLTTPIPNSLNFSGTEQQALSMTFKPYVDESKNSKASVGGFGDWLALVNL